ncbi:hypothetical protein EKO04_011577 [Ascochyta lentis]|uniref:Uncharacterized protein n=1 Tax=Ascochyta lentis TaxID=205686 RepID=A0A8H7ISH0_9PLEO|nr:hypothetical protein EKO04_011577 [Ascochyta lentis]
MSQLVTAADSNTDNTAEMVIDHASDEVDGEANGMCTHHHNCHFLSNIRAPNAAHEGQRMLETSSTNGNITVTITTLRGETLQSSFHQQLLNLIDQYYHIRRDSVTSVVDEDVVTLVPDMQTIEDEDGVFYPIQLDIPRQSSQVSPMGVPTATSNTTDSPELITRVCNAVHGDLDTSLPGAVTGSPAHGVERAIAVGRKKVMRQLERRNTL